MTSELRPELRRNALLIHNPNAGSAGKRRRPLLEEARRILSAGGIEAELAENTGPNDAHRNRSPRYCRRPPTRNRLWRRRHSQ